MRKLWGIPAYCMQGYWWILQWEALSRFWITPWQSTAKKMWSKPTNVKLFVQRWHEVAISSLPPPPTPLPSLPRHSPVPTVALWVKCFAQEHSTLTGPGLDPRCLDLQLSALMPLHLYRIMSNRPLCCFWWHVEVDFHSHCVHLTIIIIIIIVNASLQISSSQLKSASHSTPGAPFSKRFPSITGGTLQYSKHPFYSSPWEWV